MALIRVCLLVVALVPAIVGRLSAAAIEVDLELVLAVDVSRSIDEDEARLQRDGYLRALRDPRVARAIQNGPLRRIALAYVEWAGAHYQRIIVDWTLIKDLATAHAFADRLERAPRIAENWTSISAAIDFCVSMFGNNIYEGTRRVIDVSGDGSNNRGRPILAARDDAVTKGITINGLPIVNDRPSPFGFPAEKDLDKYYEQNVIGGPGALMIVATSFDTFAQAVLTKLIKEIAADPVDHNRDATRQTIN
ncbi:MAG: DUF1194 domain-containing protein [Alphaproteobacteria bacterium]|nr:DUF1194 domain-containing protein [Alphaproteobacteria bacterium]